MPPKIKILPKNNPLELIDELKNELNNLERTVKDYQYWREQAALSRKQLKKNHNKK